MFLKFLETILLKKVCLASNRVVQMFRVGPNLQSKRTKLLFILDNKNVRLLYHETFEGKEEIHNHLAMSSGNVDHIVHFGNDQGIGVEP